MTLKPVETRGPWRHYCDYCHDTGWRTVAPSAEETARLVRLYGEVPAHADYVVKCEPCKWQQMEREKRRKQQEPDAPEDMVTAARRKRDRR